MCKVFTQIFSFVYVQLFNRFFTRDLKHLKSHYLLVFTIFCLINCFFGCPFNSLLLRRECCSFSNGEYVRAGLCELENWCFKATDEVSFFHSPIITQAKTSKLTSNNKQLQYAGTSWEELKHIRQAIGFLVNLSSSSI